MGEDWLIKLGERVRERREALGMTVEKLADRTGHSKSTISDIENAQTPNPRVATLREIADALSLPRAALGVAGEEDLPSIRADIQHLIHLLGILPEDRSQWYVETMSREIEKARRGEPTQKKRKSSGS